MPQTITIVLTRKTKTTIPDLGFTANWLSKQIPNLEWAEPDESRTKVSEDFEITSILTETSNA